MDIAPIRVPSPTWARGRAWIEDDQIVLDKGRTKVYDVYGFESPRDSERMAFDLTSLAGTQQDERKIVSFVMRWGLLWHGEEDLDKGECRETLQDWWTEAARLWFVGALYTHLMDSKDEGSATTVQKFLRRFGFGFPSLPPTHIDFDNRYITGASKMIQDLINEGLNAGSNQEPQSAKGKRRCWWGLAAGGPGDFVLIQYPPDLLTRAYSAFAWLIANNVETRICPVCNSLFRPKPRQGVCCSPAHQSTYRARKSRADA
jgi:hypothetical protein